MDSSSTSSGAGEARQQKGRRKRSASLSSVTPAEKREKMDPEVLPEEKERAASDDDIYERDDNDLEYEDVFDDEFEEEVVVMGGDEDEAMEEDEEEEVEAPAKVWRPGVDPINEGEELDYDCNAYEMMYRLNVEWPCLSFDVMRDKLGFQRQKFPHTVYFVAGTQADAVDNNRIYVMKASQLYRTKHDDNQDSDDSDDDDNFDDDPLLDSRYVKHRGAVNRIRSMPQQSHIVASWSDIGEVNLWDLSPFMKALDGPSKIPTITPLYTSKHKQEGFAMDWSPVAEGRLVTGDCAKHIHLWEPAEGGRWVIDSTPFVGHQHFVEDLQWSPTEATVFASSSSDRTVKVWDTRNKRGPALSFEAHTSDVNVISWNKKVGYLMVSGAEDGSFSIWDFRYIQQGKPAANFKWHTTPISTVEWHSEEESVLAVGTNDQITLWDLALEKDEENEKINDGEVAVPAQLLFVHQGQTDVKELHWHPQIPGLLLSTAANGFHAFKTINA